jgi:hypothetical protein
MRDYSIRWGKKGEMGGIIIPIECPECEVEACDIDSAFQIAMEKHVYPEFDCVKIYDLGPFSFWRDKIFDNPHFDPASAKIAPPTESMVDPEIGQPPDQSEDISTDSPYDETVRLLQQIEENTRRAAEQSTKAADWLRFLSMPLLFALIVGIIIGLKECS